VEEWESHGGRKRGQFWEWDGADPEKDHGNDKVHGRYAREGSGVCGVASVPPLRGLLVSRLAPTAYAPSASSGQAVGCILAPLWGSERVLASTLSEALKLRHRLLWDALRCLEHNRLCRVVTKLLPSAESGLVFLHSRLPALRGGVSRRRSQSPGGGPIHLGRRADEGVRPSISIADFATPRFESGLMWKRGTNFGRFGAECVSVRLTGTVGETRD